MFQIQLIKALLFSCGNDFRCCESNQRSAAKVVGRNVSLLATGIDCPVSSRLETISSVFYSFY